MVEFKLFGIPVRVEMAFWITIGILGFINTDLRSDPNALLNVALFILAGFISILIHELGHALMIKRYKLPTQIVLSSFGGYATFPPGYLTRAQSFLVTAAGPALQALSGLGVAVILRTVEIEAPKIFYFLLIYMIISFFWAILNCIPVIPLDGGRMMEAILGPKRQALTFLISMIVAAVAGIAAALNGMIFGAIFMGMFGYQSFQGWQHFKGRR